MKVPNNAKVTVTKYTRRKKKSSFNRGIIDGDYEVEYLPRRKGGAIFIRDCAMELISGTYRNIDYGVGSVEIINPSGPVTTIHFPPPIQADYDARDLELFGGTYIPDREKFKELKPSALGLDNYELTLKTSNGDFTFSESNNDKYSGGWKIPTTFLSAGDIRIAGTEDASINIGGYWFETLYLKGANSDRHKVTASYDYSAPGVSFTPSANMEIFLIPRFNLDFFGISYNLTLPITTHFYDFKTPGFIFRDREAYIEGGESPAITFDLPDSYSAPEAAEWAAKYPDFIRRKNYNSNAANYRIDFDGTHTGTVEDISNFLNPADPKLPPPPGLPLNTHTSGDPAIVFASLSPQSGLYFPGQLVGIIKKGSTYYYFWNEATG